jgi:group II intron reverse transcriptase/maturase
VSESKSQVKPFEISKRVVWEAYLRVKANKGAPGVDGVTIEQYEQDLRNNLFKLWNRLSSGSYFPPAVKAVEIPKAGGKGVRVLGVPTVDDRIAQTVAAMYLERQVEPVFHPDSYGYRPGRSALDAVGRCRERCWRSDWVVDLDIRAFFDSVDHSLMLKAVARHTDQKWILLYVQRWLVAPLRQQDGILAARDRGTPQGSSISPVLANLYLHYAFDMWLVREFPAVTFERYCDDAVIHCGSEEQACHVRDALAARLATVGLELHPDKTRIVYCKDADRRGDHEVTSFTFPRVHVPAEAGQEQVRQELRVVPARGQQGRDHGDGSGDPVLAHRPAQRQVPQRPGIDVQQHRAGLDQLLWALLQVHVVSPPEAHQRASGALGHTQVQTATPARTAGARTPGGSLTAIATTVRPLALRPQT